MVELDDVSYTIFEIHQLPTILHSSEADRYPRFMTLMISFDVDTLFTVHPMGVRLKND